MRLTDAELVERLRRDEECIRLLEIRLAKSAIPEAEWDHGDDLAAFKIRAALATELLELRAARAWQPIETAPPDQELLLGWWEEWPKRRWREEVGPAQDTKGGWLHGAATHWMTPPAPAKALETP